MKYISDKDAVPRVVMLEAAENFQKQVTAMIPKFHPIYMMNTDQYQAIIGTTLAYKELKTMFPKNNSMNKILHIYIRHSNLLLCQEKLFYMYFCVCKNQQTNLVLLWVHW
jgi:hypothetical protein